MYFFNNTTQIQTNIDNDSTPTHDQFCSYVSTVSNQAKTLSAGAPSRIIDLICSNFSSVGWDPRNNRVIQSRASLLTPPAVAAALTSLKSELENWSPPVDSSPEELASLDLATSRLWDLDTNRCVPGTDYVINPQSGKSMWEEGDFADEKVRR